MIVIIMKILIIIHMLENFEIYQKFGRTVFTSRLFATSLIVKLSFLKECSTFYKSKEVVKESLYFF